MPDIQPKGASCVNLDEMFKRLLELEEEFLNFEEAVLGRITDLEQQLEDIMWSLQTGKGDHYSVGMADQIESELKFLRKLLGENG
jgi:hypothetical protein